MLGIILAGGYSSRAQLNKLLLDFHGEPLICRTIHSMRPFAKRIVVVTGRFDKELREALQNQNTDLVYNKNYDLGMFSSVLTGVNESRDEDILLIPGDIPNVSKKTFESVLGSTGSIRIPTYLGQTGHPLFIEKRLVSLLKKEPVNSNLHLFIEKHKNEITHVEVNDPFINFDVDTMDDYQKLQDMVERK